MPPWPEASAGRAEWFDEVEIDVVAPYPGSHRQAPWPSWIEEAGEQAERDLAMIGWSSQTERQEIPRRQASISGPSAGTSALNGIALYGLSMCHNEALIHLFTEAGQSPSRAENGGGG